jgi:hypothetical protein
MSTSPAFDLALFVAPPAHVQDGMTVLSLGPPLVTKASPLVVGAQPGITVGATMPAATAGNQILISGTGAGFPWGLGTNPAASASVPAPSAQNDVLLADGTPAWQRTPVGNMLLTGGAVTVSAGGTFQASVSLTFTPSASLTTVINGTDPTKSAIDNMSIDAGTF